MALYIMAVRCLRAFLTLLIWESFVVCNGTVSTASSNAFSTWTLSATSAAATSSDAENLPTVSTTNETATAANTTATNSGTENDPTVSIASSNAYASQRPCIQSCIMEASNGIDVGCGNPLLNSCFCHVDLQSSVLYQVSSCINVNCNGTTTDINNVISLYTIYCSTAALSTTSATTSATMGATATVANTTATNSGVQKDPTVSIASSNAYATQRPCVQNCIIGASNGIDVGCGNPLLNSCFCRANLEQVSACVSVNCNGATTDINNAISLYTLYCSSSALTASMAATSRPGEAQPSVTSSRSSVAQSTGKLCSWLAILLK